MKKLSKQQQEEQENLVNRLLSQKEDVEDAFNRLKDEIEAYNEIVQEAEGWRSDIVGEMDAYYEDRSEKWQEGDTGSAYFDWKSEWENEELSEIDAPSEPDMDQAETLDNLSVEPGQ